MKQPTYTDIKPRKISVEELRKLKEEDVLFITIPGHMGDETGSTFIIKSGDGFVTYRVDWAIENPEISAEDMSLVFPQWHKYDRKNSRYIRIDMGFRNILCVKKDIIDDYIPLLEKAIYDEYGDDAKNYGNIPILKTNRPGEIPIYLAGVNAFRVWGYAAKAMLGDKLR